MNFFLLESNDYLKIVIQWALFIWSLNSGAYAKKYRLKIISPAYDDDDNIINGDRFKTILEELRREATSRLNSTQFDLNAHLKEAMEPITEQDFVSFYMKILRPIPEEERENLTENIWQNISPYIQMDD